MDILPVIALGFGVILSLQVKQVVLDLKSNPHSFCEPPQYLSLPLGQIQVNADKLSRQSGKYSSFMRCHLQILLLSGVLPLEFIHIVPQYVPALPNMEACHFLGKYAANLHLLVQCKFFAPQQIVQGGEVHEVAGIDTDINSVYQMNTLFVSSYGAGVFYVIHDQGAVMNYLAQGSNVKYLLFFVPVQLGNEHAEYGPPAFTSPI